MKKTLTQEQKELIFSLARGHVQRDLARDLANHRCTMELYSYMKAQTEYTSYMKSFRNFFSRLENAGFKLDYRSGKLGGDWSARVYLIV